MRKNLGAKPLLFPQPVLMIATYDANGKPNVMNAAWGGIVGSNEIIIELGSHQTTDNLAVRGAFTVSPADAAHVVACDYVGIVSGRTEPNKMEKAGFTTVKSTFVDAPVIEQLPLTLECKLVKIIDDKKYLGEIVNVAAEESILDEKGEVTLTKFSPIIFDAAHYGYYKFGEQVGTAFHDGNALK